MVSVEICSLRMHIRYYFELSDETEALVSSDEGIVKM